MPKPKLITARATVNLAGLTAGDTALVDPTDRRVAGLLRTGLLVDQEAPTVEPPATTVTGGRSSVKPQEHNDRSGDTEQASRRARPKSSTEASESGTE